ncbi:MAG TPA: acyl-CoA dehydrogenase family protein [Solirubrobacteraceae bacterium]|jgi:alkylation response protein AidB-like acyl-CoA dehydrogenase|nr:acyl-CoA dehydrogenase family protein [Solirubrobacteraceae bacterium]
MATPPTATTDAGSGNAELLERARALFPLLRQNMAKTDQERRLPQENVDALIEAGLFRTWMPRRYGGFEADIKTGLRISAELARGCPATGWNNSMMNAAGYLAWMLPVQGQEEIISHDPAPRFAGVFTPKPEHPVRPVDGGYVISGKWPFASGCLHSTWSMAPAPLIQDGQMVNALLLFAPSSEFEIIDDWYVLGMRGTGSNTLVANELFVPTHRTLNMMGPQGIIESVIPSEHRDSEALYRVPIGTLAGAVTGIAALGIARAALEYVLEKLPSRTVSYSTRIASQVVPNQMLLAEAAHNVDLATFLFDRLGDDLYAAGVAGGPPEDVRLRARMRNDAGYAVELCRRAVEAVVTVSGASSMREGSALQQWHRDMRTASLHGASISLTTLEQYGASLVGEQSDASFLL